MGLQRFLSLTVCSLLLLSYGRLNSADGDDDYQPSNVVHLDQGWPEGWKVGQSNWYHHASQGTIIVPYDWFVCLEQPTTQPDLPEQELFCKIEHLKKFGFLASVHDEKYNPDDLPVGFAIEDDFVDPNKPNRPPYRAVGLTCAACHTSEITYQGTRIRIEGGSALIDISAFQKSLALSLIITNSSAKKFESFAQRVLKQSGAAALPEAAQHQAKAMLKGALEEAVLEILEQQRTEAALQLRTLEAGFGRTDALTLIGNRVFRKLGKVNLAKASAPVNYPHLWQTPWFYWVQYNASIRLPMVRNIGEALGVGAKLGPNFESTVNVENLHLMEDQLAGKQPFTGLSAPPWPEDVLGEIEGFRQQTGKWKTGKLLYEKLCIDCHYRIEDYETALTLDTNDPRFRRHWSQPNRFGRSYMKLPFINYVDLGTDPAAARDFHQRIVYIGSLDYHKPTLPAGEALALTTAKVREREFANLGLSPAEYASYDGYRELGPEPGAIDRLEYKARPLDGVWATAPYLHNGSVPNLYELLSPVIERSTNFYVGSTEFDPKRVGLSTAPDAAYFQMNTKLPGNLNTGHEFRQLTKREQQQLTEFQRQMLGESSGWAVNGVVGPYLKPEERWALIEYVKSLGTPLTPEAKSLEDPPPGEEIAIKTLAGIQHALQTSSEIAKAHRGQHPKNHGAVWARFEVSDDVPNRLKKGLFKNAADYNCVIRFSNGAEQEDNKQDVHGMAIKVIKSKYGNPQQTETQDFLLADNPVFFAKNVEHLLGFLSEMKTANGDKQLERQIAVKLALSTHPALRGFRKHLKTSPLQATYWSQTPYQLGHTAVKYKVVPREDNFYPVPIPGTPANALREAMVQRLTQQRRPAVFDFFVQEYTDALTTPIEDPTVEWPSPPIKMATITIYPQKFDSKQQMEFCENLTFTPWRAAKEHRPLGGINRARQAIYEASSKLRHQTRGVEQSEPTGREWFFPSPEQEEEQDPSSTSEAAAEE